MKFKYFFSDYIYGPIMDFLSAAATTTAIVLILRAMGVLS